MIHRLDLLINLMSDYLTSLPKETLGIVLDNLNWKSVYNFSSILTKYHVLRQQITHVLNNNDLFKFNARTSVYGFITDRPVLCDYIYVNQDDMYTVFVSCINNGVFVFTKTTELKEGVINITDKRANVIVKNHHVYEYARYHNNEINQNIKHVIMIDHSKCNTQFVLIRTEFVAVLIGAITFDARLKIPDLAHILNKTI